MAKIYIANDKIFNKRFNEQMLVELDKGPSLFDDEIVDFIKENNRNHEPFCKEVADITDKGTELWILRNFLDETCTCGGLKIKKKNFTPNDVLQKLFCQYLDIGRNGWVIPSYKLSDLQQNLLTSSRSRSFTEKKQKWLLKVANTLERVIQISKAVPILVIYKNR